MSDKEKNIHEEEEQEADMGFLGHLEELRNRIIYALIGLVVGSIIAGVFYEFLLDKVLLAPAESAGMKLQNLRVMGQPILIFKAVFVCGIIIAFPFILYQLWKFVSPGLYTNERRWVRTITFFTTLCFLTGVLFAYFVIIPTMMAFVSGFKLENIDNIFDANDYFSFITTMLLAAGLLFEMPMISYVLSKAGILNSKFLRKYRRHSIVFILILAAILTPTPDPVSQLVFAAPLFLLYELSIYISKVATRKRALE